MSWSGVDTSETRLQRSLIEIKTSVCDLIAFDHALSCIEGEVTLPFTYDGQLTDYPPLKISIENNLIGKRQVLPCLS